MNKSCSIGVSFWILSKMFWASAKTFNERRKLKEKEIDRDLNKFTLKLGYILSDVSLPNLLQVVQKDSSFSILSQTQTQSSQDALCHMLQCYHIFPRNKVFKKTWSNILSSSCCSTNPLQLWWCAKHIALTYLVPQSYPL